MRIKLSRFILGYAIFNIVNRIIYEVELPDVATAAVPTTDETAITIDVEPAETI